MKQIDLENCNLVEQCFKRRLLSRICKTWGTYVSSNCTIEIQLCSLPSQHTCRIWHQKFYSYMGVVEEWCSSSLIQERTNINYWRIVTQLVKILPHPYIFLRRIMSASLSCSAVPSLLVGTLDI